MHPLNLEQCCHLVKYIALVLSIVLCAVTHLLESDLGQEPQPYHTSRLSGEDWVLELIAGHPERIRCKLGMHVEVFQQLIVALRQLGLKNSRPANKQELFNLWHVLARNVIERIFGVIKCRFRILSLVPPFNLRTQAQLPAALCTLHNFIRIHDPFEGKLPEDFGAPFDAGVQGGDGLEGPSVLEGNGEHPEACILHDQIAEAMWIDYQAILREREGAGHMELLEDESDMDVDGTEDEYSGGEEYT
ncbi:hypothetical protein M404DRAFT_30450 [Pisolithus tinctorius Marx 270]|uniref:DUF8040 domain-containing protein n=1 Tax=Pisolithus tinctorius Marx 270 TaxID=870435 RepID=A0A0C3NW48_PISTI|nr:hypothetical protein M404DRAFT_30450 [Pisolithus tinctorius Marx 270]